MNIKEKLVFVKINFDYDTLRWVVKVGVNIDYGLKTYSKSFAHIDKALDYIKELDSINYIEKVYK